MAALQTVIIIIRVFAIALVGFWPSFDLLSSKTNIIDP
jgi:hypothetical protein